MHQGKDEENKKLKNASYYAQVFKCNNENKTLPTETADKIKSLIKEHYIGQPLSVVFSSDGTREFKTIAKVLNAKQNLDKYHLIWNLYYCFKHRKKRYTCFPKEVRKQWFKQLKDMAFKHPNMLVDEIKLLIDYASHYHQKHFLDDLVHLKKYVINNLNGIQFWQDKEWYPVTTEAFVFHKIKRILGDKNKIFSLGIFKKLLNFKLSIVN